MAAGAAPLVVLTRPQGQNESLAALLAARGWQAIELPALRLEAVPTPLPDLAAFDTVIFVSGNAARLLLDRAVTQAGPGWRWPSGVAAAVVGPSSAAALRAHPAFGDAPVVIQPPEHSERFDSEALWQVLSTRLPRRVLIVRGGSGEADAGGDGREWLASRLREAGVAPTVYQAYRRSPQAWPPAQLARLDALAADGVPALWLLTSREGVDAIAAQLKPRGLLPWWAGCKLLTIHPRIAEHLRAVLERELPMGFAAPLVAANCAPAEAAILAAIESLL